MVFFEIPRNSIEKLLRRGEVRKRASQALYLGALLIRGWGTAARELRRSAVGRLQLDG